MLTQEERTNPLQGLMAGKISKIGKGNPTVSTLAGFIAIQDSSKPVTLQPSIPVLQSHANLAPTHTLKKATFELDKLLHSRFKAHCAVSDVNMNTAIEALIRQSLDKHENHL